MPALPQYQREKKRAYDFGLGICATTCTIRVIFGIRTRSTMLCGPIFDVVLLHDMTRGVPLHACLP